jgi:hypothetical protein
MKRRSKKVLEKICGTQAAFERHLARGERPCNKCLAASHTYTDFELAGPIREARERSKEAHLWETYGISMATFEHIFSEQGFCCACCKSADAKSDLGWCVDHDHETQEVRGILCSTCNTGIGMLGDRLESVQQAVTYLQAHEDRGGHPKDRKPPVCAPISIEYSARIKECFELFEQGLTVADVVMRLRQDPVTISEILWLWKDGKARLRKPLPYKPTLDRGRKRVLKRDADPPHQFVGLPGLPALPELPYGKARKRDYRSR